MTQATNANQLTPRPEEFEPGLAVELWDALAEDWTPATLGEISPSFAANVDPVVRVTYPSGAERAVHWSSVRVPGRKPGRPGRPS